MKITQSKIRLTGARRVVLTLLVICGLLTGGIGSAAAATLDNACALLFEKLYANIAARGEIVALLPEKDEVVIEFDDDLIPAYGAELMVFAVSGDRPVSAATAAEEEVVEETIPANPTLIFRGSVTVSESAGHLNLAYVNPGSEKFAEGDRVFLPTPVQLYITPVKNLTPYPYFAPQATAAIARMLKTLPGIAIFNLPASNQKTVAFLLEKCRNEGRYGLIVQPDILMPGNRSKVQLRLTSLFSGQSLGALTENFTPALAPLPPTRYNQYPPPAR